MKLSLLTKIARKLASMDNTPFDELKEHATSFNESPTQAHYLRRAKAVILELLEVVEGAGLTPNEIVEILKSHYHWAPEDGGIYGIGEKKAIAKAQLQKVKRLSRRELND